MTYRLDPWQQWRNDEGALRWEFGVGRFFQVKLINLAVFWTAAPLLWTFKLTPKQGFQIVLVVVLVLVLDTESGLKASRTRASTSTKQRMSSQKTPAWLRFFSDQTSFPLAGGRVL